MPHGRRPVIEAFGVRVFSSRPLCPAESNNELYGNRLKYRPAQQGLKALRTKKEN